ncbi:MAG: hypothetical protein HQM08_27625 [Candidatus Riflebacteria bacterium]|nr:hypothetical protein [Candidatus Riflebacteria bacterium]
MGWQGSSLIMNSLSDSGKSKASANRMLARVLPRGLPGDRALFARACQPIPEVVAGVGGTRLRFEGRPAMTATEKDKVWEWIRSVPRAGGGN